MERSADIDYLKSKGVKERDLEMFQRRMKGETYKEIAKSYGLKNAVSVSRRVKKVQSLLKDMGRGIKTGDIVLRNAGVQTGLAKSQIRAGSVSLPTNNPFLQLETFEELAGMSSAGGAVIGAGAATLFQGFTREDLPYEQRTVLAMKGGSVLASSLLSLFLTFKKFSADGATTPKEIKEGEAVD